MNELTKTVLISASVFAMLTAANVAAKSIYTNSKIGLDTRALLISGIVGVGVGYFSMKYLK